MKITATVTKAGANVSTIDINAGEPLAIPLQNTDGSAWSTTGASVVAYSPTAPSTPMSQNPWTITGGALQLTAIASAALTPGKYRVQIWSSTGTLATDGSADLVVVVH